MVKMGNFMLCVFITIKNKFLQVYVLPLKYKKSFLLEEGPNVGRKGQQ